MLSGWREVELAVKGKVAASSLTPTLREFRHGAAADCGCVLVLNECRQRGIEIRGWADVMRTTPSGGYGLNKQKEIVDDPDRLLEVLPQFVRETIEDQEDLTDLIGVLDLGRRPGALFRQFVCLSEKEISREHIDTVLNWGFGLITGQA